MSQRFGERALSLFVEASELASDERGPFLERECGGDHALQSEVESLFALDLETPDALRTGGLLIDPAQLPVPAPESIGQYTVLERLGAGGMGVVYLAQQHEPVARRVALKVVRLGFETPGMLARFQVERQALAKMSHPYIAGVLDAGCTEQGRPWFAMEHIQGEPILRYCATHELGLRERLELLVRVCRGVQHAHRNAIIHRDLKPSNILVVTEDGEPIPKIIDFGIAKVLDGQARQAQSTIQGAFIGTPEYMSPEQLSAGTQTVDTRTDVHALGILLYELITGQHPYVEQGKRTSVPEELWRRVRESDPARPSTRVSPLADAAPSTQNLARRLRGDLDWIALKALARDPDDRYDAPIDLADDIRRHLDDRPVSATPPRLSYTLGRFLRRHRAAAIAITLLTGLLTASVAAGVSTRSANRLSAFLAELFDMSSVDDPRDPADRFDHFATTTRSVLPDSSPERADILLQLAGFAPSPAQAIDLQSEAHRIYVDRLGRASRKAVEALHDLARNYRDVGRYDEAEAALIELFGIVEPMAAPDDPIVAEVAADLGRLYASTNRAGQADPYLSLAAQHFTGLYGPDDPRTLRAKGWLGSNRASTGRNDEGLELLAEVIERADPEVELSRQALRAAHYQIALIIRNNPAASDEDLARGIEHLRQAVELGFSPGLHTGLHAYRDVPGFDAVRRMAEFNTGVVWERAASQGLAALGGDRLAEAERLFSEVVAGAVRARRQDHPGAMRAREKLAAMLVEQRRCEEAVPHLVIRTQLLSRNVTRPLELGDVHWERAGCALLMGDLDEANAQIERAGELYGAVTESRNASYIYYLAGRHALDGQIELGLQELASAIDNGATYFDYMRRDPVLEPLHGPRFDELTRQR